MGEKINIVDDNIKTCFTCSDFFTLKSSDEVFKSHVSFCTFSDRTEIVMLRRFLHDSEKSYFKTLKYETKINSYLLGRYAAKKAVSAVTGEEDLRKIAVINGIFSQPIVTFNEHGNIKTSITHCGNLGAAVAFPDLFLVGIDIEKADTKNRRAFETQLTQYEKQLACRVPYSYDVFLVLIWTIKESLSKVLKTGLTVPFEVLEVKGIETSDGYSTSCFSNFSQYSTVSFMADDYACSITYPKNAEICIDVPVIKGKLLHMIQQTRMADVSEKNVSAISQNLFLE